MAAVMIILVRRLTRGVEAKIGLAIAISGLFPLIAP
jgi:hypothetical protein